MTSHDWLENPNELERVKELLTQTGYPLEVRVASVCEAFDDWSRVAWTHSASKWHNPFVYRDGGAIREVDRLLQMQAYTEIANDEGYGLALALTVPIECKHRDSVAIFGFPTPDLKHATLPIFSSYAPTRLFQMLGRQKPPFEPQGPCIATMLEKDAKGWKKSSREELFHNASSSLYDALSTMLTVDADFRPRWVPGMADIDDIIESLPTRARADLQTIVHYHLQKVSEDRLNGFNQLVDEFYDLDVEIIMPVVAVDMPLYRVSLGANGDVEGIEPVSWLATYQRVGSGLDSYHDQLTNPGLELPVIIVHVDGLDALLKRLVAWCNELIEILYSADGDLWRHFLLESAVFWGARNRKDQSTKQEE